MNKAIIITLLALIASIGLASAIVVYQENPSTTPVVTWVGDGGYIDINYTIPQGTQGALWQVKHGHSFINRGINASLYNVTVPSECLSGDTLQFRFWSISGTSAGQCYNGQDWETITLNITGNDGGGLSNANGPSQMWDGDWDSKASPCGGFAWCSQSESDGALVYEEAVYWYEGEPAPQLTLPCITNNDCTACSYCSAGNCIYQDSGNDIKNDCGTCNYCNGQGNCTNELWGEDVKNDCDPQVVICANNVSGSIEDVTPGAAGNSYLQNFGNCNGEGACLFADSGGHHEWYEWASLIPVSEGNVCIDNNNYDVAPTIDYNCGLWNDCITHQTSAEKYYVGYRGDDTLNCSDANWQDSSSLWTAPTGYRINVTEHAPNCSIETIPVIHHGGGGGGFPEETTTTLTPVAQEPTTFSLAGWIGGKISLWDLIKFWLSSLGVKI